MTKLNSWASSDLSEQNLGRAIYNDRISKKRRNKMEERRAGGKKREACVGKTDESL